MLNAALCEKRGEGGEHSKAPKLGLRGRSIAQAIPKEQTPPHRVAACELPAPGVSQAPMAFCSQYLGTRTHTAPQSGLSVPTRSSP